MDTNILGFRVWYDDNSVYTITSWEDFNNLPDDGFLVGIVYHLGGTKRILEGSDYYFCACHPEGLIFGTDRQYPDTNRYNNLSVKRGRWVPDHVMVRIEQEALDSTWQ